MVDVLGDSLLCAVVLGVSSFQTLDLFLYLRFPQKYYSSSPTYKTILKLLGLVALLGCVIYVFRVLVLGDLTLNGVLFLPFLIGVDLKHSQVNSRKSLLEEVFLPESNSETFFFIHGDHREQINSKLDHIEDQ
jgi:hypothetical protein